MLGKRNPQQPSFYYFNMADMIPKNHILSLFILHHIINEFSWR